MKFAPNKFFAAGALILSFNTANAFELPVTSLTKSCKPLVDTSLKIEEPKIQGYSERTGQRLTRAQEKLAEEKYEEGIELLKALEQSADSDYVKSVVNIQIAYALAQTGKQDESYPYFKNALKYGENNLPRERVQALRMTVAGFMYQNGDKIKAVQMMEEWMRKSNVHDDKAYSYLAAFYADEDVGRTKDAVCPMSFAVTTSKEPNKSYLQSLMALHWQLNDVDGAVIIQKQMLELFPLEVDYWRRLSSMYMQQDKFEDALAILDMLYLQGKMDVENDYKQLSSLYSYAEIPLKAARILEEGLNKGTVKAEEKNWKNVALNYRISKALDKSIAAYQKTADLSATGDAYVKQAEIYSEKEDWSKAVSAIDKALERGGLDNLGNAYLEKGKALIANGQCSKAFKSLEEAMKYSNYKSYAENLVAYGKDLQERKKC